MAQARRKNGKSKKLLIALKSHRVLLIMFLMPAMASLTSCGTSGSYNGFCNLGYIKYSDIQPLEAEKKVLAYNELIEYFCDVK